MSTRDRQDRAPRFPITVFIGAGEEIVPLGRTRNISMSGVFLETEARPAIGTEEQISIVWGEDTCVCSARVVRHDEDGIGMTFVNPDAVFANAIHEIIDSSDEPDESP